MYKKICTAVVHVWESRFAILIWASFTFSIIVSLGGIEYAVKTNNPSNGGRGGAVGDTIALVILFIDRDSGRRVYNLRTIVIPRLLESIDKLTDDSEQINVVEQVRRDVDILDQRLSAKTHDQFYQTAFMAIATAISTITWGFGDLFALWLINYFHGPKWV